MLKDSERLTQTCLAEKIPVTQDPMRHADREAVTGDMRANEKKANPHALRLGGCVGVDDDEGGEASGRLRSCRLACLAPSPSRLACRVHLFVS